MCVPGIPAVGVSLSYTSPGIPGRNRGGRGNGEIDKILRKKIRSSSLAPDLRGDNLENVEIGITDSVH